MRGVIRSLARQIQNALVVLLQVDPHQQVASAIFVLLFVVAINVASNAGSTLLAGIPAWLLLLAPLAVFLLFAVWLALHRRQLPPPRPPAMAPNLGEYPALVAMLGIFVSRGDPQHADAARRQEWRLPHLRTALDADAPDWDAILDRVEASNLQPLLQAIRHHDRHGGLHHIWLISTADVVAEDGRVLQAGSCHLAPCVERIVRQGLHHDLAVHHTDPMLLVLPDDIGSSYRAVNEIYMVAAPRLGLHPYQVIADITGGRATMTAGMILACAPRGYPLQYTSTVVDPATKQVTELPQPQRLRVDTRAVLRQALEAVNARLGVEE